MPCGQTWQAPSTDAKPGSQERAALPVHSLSERAPVRVVNDPVGQDWHALNGSSPVPPVEKVPNSQGTQPKPPVPGPQVRMVQSSCLVAPASAVVKREGHDWQSGVASPSTPPAENVPRGHWSQLVPPVPASQRRTVPLVEDFEKERQGVCERERL